MPWVMRGMTARAKFQSAPGLEAGRCFGYADSSGRCMGVSIRARP